MALEPRYASVEDALYCEHSVVTVAITHEWANGTDMLVLVQGFNAGEDFTVDAFLDDVRPTRFFDGETEEAAL
jgi:hypothetical protein